MKHKHKPGDMFVIKNIQIGNFANELIVIVGPSEMTLSGLTYRVYNQTFEMFMERTEMFLDKFYKKVG